MLFVFLFIPDMVVKWLWLKVPIIDVDALSPLIICLALTLAAYIWSRHVFGAAIDRVA